jgi:hypothetical protein
MGTLRITDAQWTAVQAHAENPRIKRMFKRVDLGDPAGYDANGPSDTPTHWLFDDGRLPGFWRVRVAAGPTIFFQEWDALIGGTMIRELTLAEMNTKFGST